MNKKEKMTARVVGALFLIAMAASLIGAGFIESNLNAADFFSNLSAYKSMLTIGALLELVNGIAVIGIGVLMFPIFKRFDEGLALGYVAFRIIEAVFVFAALISPLAIITLSQAFTAGTLEAANFQTSGASFIAMRTLLAGQVLGIFFSLGALIFYYLLFQSKLVPRFISIWGLIAVALVFSWNLLELIGIQISVGIVFGLPIILNEIFLGIWLIAKGFQSPAVKSVPLEAAIGKV